MIIPSTHITRADLAAIDGFWDAIMYEPCGTTAIGEMRKHGAWCVLLLTGSRRFRLAPTAADYLAQYCNSEVRLARLSQTDRDECRRFAKCLRICAQIARTRNEHGGGALQ
jgi:hypothetical protein